MDDTKTNQVGITAPAKAPEAVPVARLRNVHVNPRPIRIAFCRLVRWRFDYSDGRASKFGQWCRPGTQPGDMAAFQPKENLRRAAIEVKEMLTAKTYAIAECDGADFVNFAWMGGVPMGGLLKPKPGLVQTQTRAPQIIGLSLITRDLKVSVLIDGSAPKVEPRTATEKGINYAAFGK